MYYMEIKITNITKFYTLLLLSEKEKHGYEIIKEIRKKIGKDVSPGQIYPFLKLLEEVEYIKSGEREEREKRKYKLTKKGRLFVNKMLDRFGDLIRLSIEPKLTECAHCGCKIYEGGHKEKINKKELNFCCCHCAKSFR